MCIYFFTVGYKELGLDFSTMATEQLMDGEMDAYRIAITGLQLENVQFIPKQDFLL